MAPFRCVIIQLKELLFVSASVFHFNVFQVNDGTVHSGSSFAPLSELNLETPLYLGGYRYAYSLNRYAKKALYLPTSHVFMLICL